MPARVRPRWGERLPIVWLTGFMATGKTTAGEALAGLLQRPFIDTDRLVEESAGRTVAALFASEGEAAFRRREREAVQAAARHPGAVVALGGGALLDDANRHVIQATGPLLCLTARPETVVSRLGADGIAARPLLHGPDPARAVAALMQQRETVYRVADGAVTTDGLSPDAVAAALVRWLEAQPWW